MKINLSREEILKWAARLKSQPGMTVQELNFEVNVLTNKDFFLTKSTKQNIRDVIDKYKSKSTAGEIVLVRDLKRELGLE